MAQTTSSSSTRSKRSGSRGSKSTSRNGTSRSTASRSNASSRTKRTGSNSGRARTSRRTTTSTSAGRARSSSQNGPVAAAGEKVSNVASKAKTPLVAAGAVLAGIAGGVALKSRNNQKNPVKRLRAPSMPKTLKKVDLSKIDLESITSAAHKVRSIGEQVGDVADAADKTRKKHK